MVRFIAPFITVLTFLWKEKAMNDKLFTICGHGSGTPSLKNMYTYFESRHSQKMTNKMTKELLEVRRFLTPEQAQRFPQNYKIILGRNYYNQNLRQYVYNPYTNGKYYSDCSSSLCAAYERCGRTGLGLLNTDGMHRIGTKVDVRIVNGHIVDDDLSKLQLGDAFLFRGNIDRPENGYIGHVEGLYEMPTGSWEKTPNGKWKYKQIDGNYAKDCWKLVNGLWYAFGADGIMLTGMQNIGGEIYYLEESGDYEGACWHESDKRNGSLERWYV